MGILCNLSEVQTYLFRWLCRTSGFYSGLISFLNGGIIFKKRIAIPILYVIFLLLLLALVFLFQKGCMIGNLPIPHLVYRHQRYLYVGSSREPSSSAQPVDPNEITSSLGSEIAAAYLQQEEEDTFLITLSDLFQGGDGSMGYHRFHLTRTIGQLFYHGKLYMSDGTLEKLPATARDRPAGEIQSVISDWYLPHEEFQTNIEGVEGSPLYTDWLHWDTVYLQMGDSYRKLVEYK